MVSEAGLSITMRNMKISNNDSGCDDDDDINSKIIYLFSYTLDYTVLICISGWISDFLVWNQSELHARHFTKQ